MISETPLPERLGGNFKPASAAQYAFLNSPAEMILYGGAAGALKFLSVTTPIPTCDGWTTMEHIQIGDRIFDGDGKICYVTQISPIRIDKPSFEIEFDNGEIIVASDDHKWVTMTESERNAAYRRTSEVRATRRTKRKLRGTGKKPWLSIKNAARALSNAALLLESPNGEVRTTIEILNSLKGHDGRPNHSVGVPPPLALPDIELPIPPYTLGVWLGDGTSNDGGITSADPEILEHIREDGFIVQKSKAKYRWGTKGLSRLLRLNGLRNNKHIPPAYLRASISQRLALLQGLMDTDGTSSLRGPVFNNSNKRLIEQVRELVLSLGMKAELSEWMGKLNGVETKPAYGLSFAASFQVFRLTRKATRQVIASRPSNTRRYIVDVREITPVPVRCIAVDAASHTFLASRSFIPTHNSQSLLVDASLLYRRKNYSAIIFRKTLDELRFLINRGVELYVNGLGATYNEQQKTFKWPWGAQIKFTYLENENDVFRLQGNEYQFVGFDESTHFMEFQIRYMINSRMRSVDNIPLKARLATNPGGVGHDYHMKIFMGKRCVHCMIGNTPDVRLPFMIYPSDGEQAARWPSDKKVIGYTTQFIPGRVSDHTIFGVGGIDYKKKLAGLPDALAEALMNGCWAAFEGQYFNIWDPSTMIVPYASINPQSWWPFWGGLDWGFGHMAAAYLFTKSPSGITYVLEGHEANGDGNVQKTKASSFAMQIRDKWGRYKPEPFFLSHETFGNKGEELTIAEQMMNASDIGFVPSNRDPEGRAMMMYTMLNNGLLKLSDDPSVEALATAIQTRIHDPKNRDSVKKVDEDADDRYDGAGYGLTSYIEDAKDSTVDDIKKRAEKIGLGDPTQVMLQYQLLKGKQDSDGDQIYYRGGRLRSTARR